MKEQAITDSTCLIGLERIGQLSILPELFSPLSAPPEVQREFGAALPWLSVKAPADATLVAALQMVVDDGEAEVIALAKEIGCRAILDDRRARAAASRLNVPCIGTVGVLLRAKRNGVISAIKPLLDDLHSNRFFISEALRSQALLLAAE